MVCLAISEKDAMKNNEDILGQNKTFSLLGVESAGSGEEKNAAWFPQNETCLATKFLTLKISNAICLVYPKLHMQILRCHRKTRTFLKIKWGKGFNVGWNYSWLHHCWGQLKIFNDATLAKTPWITTTRILEMLGRFLNLNKMKTKRISNHMSQYFIHNRT